MERESTKHNPRIDDQMVHESAAMLQGQSFDEGREEGFTQEAPEDPGAGRRPEVPIPDSPVQPDDADLRAELAASLRPSAFPATDVDLRIIARDEHAREPVLDLLDALPEGMYQTVAEVWEATGGQTEHRNGTFGH